jgi:Ca2+-binding EF-hand superfamily protein
LTNNNNNKDNNNNNREGSSGSNQRNEINVEPLGEYLHFVSAEEAAAVQDHLSAERSTMKLDTKQILDLKEAFDIFDADGSETIDVSELTEVVKLFRENITDEEVSNLLGKYDSDGSGEIDFPEFVALMAPIFKMNDRDSAIHDAFNVFDSDKSGYIDAKNLLIIMKGMGDMDITGTELIAAIQLKILYCITHYLLHSLCSLLYDHHKILLHRHRTRCFRYASFGDK